ncbi:hypothetical protein H5410_059292 [Solanum commersonii]|uniref:Uncharacterized protein n=1 Tax=Solanum commersonii TaxID=4109 RepID=A0A9J5W301_SOLCO|nr:hypothetical protein H5410_059292 [Solanum commersonii]
MLTLFGNGPDKELLDKSKFSRCVKFKIEEGNGPMKLLNMASEMIGTKIQLSDLCEVANGIRNETR